jgi:hypothetical protein
LAGAIWPGALNFFGADDAFSAVFSRLAILPLVKCSVKREKVCSRIKKGIATRLPHLLDVLRPRVQNAPVQFKRGGVWAGRALLRAMAFIWSIGVA